MVTGTVYPQVERKLPNYPAMTPRVVFRNLANGMFEELVEEAGPGVAAKHSSRGCAFEDFDNDGDLDILIVNLNEPPSLLRTDLRGAHHWLKMKLVGTKSNRSAIGARVLVRYGQAAGSGSAEPVQFLLRQWTCGCISVWVRKKWRTLKSVGRAAGRKSSKRSPLTSSSR
jgi:hypothetical protein